MDSPGSPSSPSSPSGSARAAATAFDNNFTVVVRVRPPLPRELEGGAYVNTVKVGSEGAEAAAAASAASIAAGGSPAEAAAAAAIAGDEKTIIISENLAALEEGAVGLYSTHTFTFDYVYGQQCDQRKVYETTAKAVVESSLKGYNATIFAYGQTGTGKTYTMEGFNSNDERGIIPRAIEQIFRHIQTSVSPRMRFLVRASYLQIYNEVISDLLKPERSNLLIREDKKKGVFVEGLSEWVVRSPAEIYGLMERGGAMRATGSTKMNELSSRSHAVFIIIAEQSETTYLDEAGNEMSVEEFHRLVKSRAHGENGLKALEANVRQSFKVGKLNLVDLAGSERVRLTGATGQRLEESKKINQSLSALGNVIAALTDPRGRQHIPYRDSKLTRILEDSLGGNCKTTMMAMISPALEAFVESLSTLKFANRAKNIKNEARINEDLDQKSLLRRYERELKRLRAELEERSRNVVDQRRLLEMDEQRRRAEEDKMAAIRALEARSKEFMREKQEKKRLEERITMLQSQVIMGGADKTNIGNWQEVPAFRNALKEHQERIRAEYDSRLAELEKERETIEEEKAQVDRYKQLLLKQRDIMILLTQRLNERDEQIMALQDELDAYDRHQRELEEKLDEKTAALIHLQRVTMEQDAVSPVRSSELAAALGAWAADRPSAGGRLEGAASVASALSFGGDGVRSASSPGGAGAAPHAPSAAAVAELTRTLDTLRNDRDRLARELEDVQSEKVSMEFLLRERLEKLVQTEIEARLKSRGGDAPALEAQVQRYQFDAEQAKAELASARADAEANAQRLVVLEKERVAISAILEGKIAKLVDSIASSSAGTAGGATRELIALQRLVHASVAALKQQS